MINDLKRLAQRPELSNKSEISLLKKLISKRVWVILTWFWLVAAVSKWIQSNHSHPSKAEQTNVIKTEKINTGFKLDDSRISFWDEDQDFFKKWYKYTKYTEYVSIKGKKTWVKIVHDAWLDFYRVWEDDIINVKVPTWRFKVIYEKDKRGRYKLDSKGKKIVAKKEEIMIIRREVSFDKIISKLQKIPKFAYLWDPEYDRSEPRNKIHSFNISTVHAAKKGMLLPIPLNSDVRELTDNKFAFYCKRAISEMKEDKKYGEKIKEMIRLSWWEDRLIAIMIAFARSESSEDYKNFTQKIWSVELHRWEEKFKSFSFTYYHILMTWPWLKARTWLGLTEGQCYHPTNSWKLFLAYWIEKSWKNLQRYFPMENKEMIKNAWKTFNGSLDYVPKLSANLNHIRLKMDWII